MVLLGTYGKSAKLSKVTKPSNQSTLSAFFGLSGSQSRNKPAIQKHESRLVKSLSDLGTTTREEIDLTSDDSDILRDISNKKLTLSSISSDSGFDQTLEGDVWDTEEDQKVKTNLKSRRPIGTLQGQKENTSLPDYNRTEQTAVLHQHSFNTTSYSTTITEFQNKEQSSSQPGKQRRLPWGTNPKGVINKLAFKNPRLQSLSKSQTLSRSRTNSEIVLSEEQQQVIKYIVEDKLNVFYTGSAGTGKSVLLKEIIKKLTKKYGSQNVAITASTGLAAVNIGGQTINRFAGIGLGKGEVKELVQRIMQSKVSEKWKKIKVLIIDEVSMIDGNLFHKLNHIAKTIRRNPQPFGGIQMIVTGDFFQLPPVPDRNGPRPIFCFQSPSWPEVIQRTILLTKVFRQKGDLQLIDMLNSLRVGQVTDDLVRQFRSLQRPVHYTDGLEPTELFPMRHEVDRANKLRLEKIPSQMRVFKAVDSGDQQYLNMLDNVMAVKELQLKENAQVMMLKNKNDFLVNGSIGRVLYFVTPILYEHLIKVYRSDLDDHDTVEQVKLLTKCIGLSYFPPDIAAQIKLVGSSKFEKLVELATRESISDILPVVKFSSIDGMSEVVLVEMEEFPIDIKGRSVVRNQLPLLLSWALSIHKSQGQTLERVKVDLNKVFENGQVYVALSRAVSKEALQIVGFNPAKIKCSAEVRKFYESLERFL